MSRSVLIKRPDLKKELSRTCQLMEQAVPDCVVQEYESLSNGLSLLDSDDVHVLAAAIRCGASVIVTFNLKDFPAQVLGKFGIEAQHPDELLTIFSTFIQLRLSKRRANIKLIYAIRRWSLFAIWIDFYVRG